MEKPKNNKDKNEDENKYISLSLWNDVKTKTNEYIKTITEINKKNYIKWSSIVVNGNFFSHYKIFD